MARACTTVDDRCRAVPTAVYLPCYGAAWRQTKKKKFIVTIVSNHFHRADRQSHASPPSLCRPCHCCTRHCTYLHGYDIVASSSSTDCALPSGTVNTVLYARSRLYAKQKHSRPQLISTVATHRSGRMVQHGQGQRGGNRSNGPITCVVCRFTVSPFHR